MVEIIKGDKVGRHFQVIKSEGLDFWVAGAIVNKQNVAVKIPSGLLTLIADATNYVFVCWEENEIEVNQLDFPSCATQLYKVTTVGNSVVEVEDLRSTIRVAAHSIAVSLDEWLLEETYIADTGWLTLDLSAIAPAEATGVLLDIYVVETGASGASIYASFRETDTSAISQEKRIYSTGGGKTDSGLGVGVKLIDEVEYRVLPSTSTTITIALAGWLFGK